MLSINITSEFDLSLLLLPTPFFCVKLWPPYFNRPPHNQIILEGINFLLASAKRMNLITVSNAPFHGRLSPLLLKRHLVFMHVIFTFLLFGSAEVEGEEERSQQELQLTRGKGVLEHEDGITFVQDIVSVPQLVRHF